MTLTRWALVAAVAFIWLALRIEARDAVLGDLLSPVVGAESFRPSMVQLGVMVLAMTAGLGLLVHCLKPKNAPQRDGQFSTSKNSALRSQSANGATTPVGLYRPKKSGGLPGRER